MENEAVATVDTTETEQPTLNIDTGVAALQPPSDAVAQTRAYKTHMGLGDVLKQDYDQIYRNISNGQEQAIRENAALDITASAMQDKQKKLTELAATKGSNLTLADVTALDATPADPKSVIEQGYARAYINTMHDAANRIEDTVLTDAQIDDPEAVKAYMNRGSDVLSKREYAATAAQNLQPRIEKNSWLTFSDPRSTAGEKINIGSYDVKQLLSLGFYESIVLRDVTGSRKSGLLGNVLEDQANAIKQLPFPEFQRKFDDIKTNLEAYDPILAQQWARAVSGFSESDKIVYNVTEAANLAMALPIGKGIKTTVGGFRDNQLNNLGDLARGPDGVYRPVSATVTTPTGSTEVTIIGPNAQARAQAAKAVQDVVNSASAPEVTKATIAEGAGDVTQAAVQKTITSITKPDPVKDATDTLFTGFRSDLETNKNNPGNLSRELHTRLLDAAHGFERNTVDLLTNSSQVVRTPNLMEEGFYSIVDKMKGYFPGRENTIADVNFRVLQMGPLTVHADFKIVNYDGNPFSSYQLAVNHANINGYDLSGIEGKAGDRVYIPAAAAKNLESVKTAPTQDSLDKIKRLKGINDLSRPQLARLEKTINDPAEVKRQPKDTIDHYKEQARLLKEGIVKNEKEIAALEQNKETKFYVTHGIEVDSSPVPVPGHIPYNLKTGKFEKALTEQSARIEQQGLGFHIVVTKPLNEAENFVRDGLISTEKSKSLSNVGESRIRQAGNVLFGGGYIRNPYDTLSKVENENRAKVVFGQSKYLDLVKEEIKLVEDIYKGMLGDRPWLVEKPLSYTRTVTGANKLVAQQFSRALEASQTMPDPRTDLPGYYMRTPAEIQHFWLSNFQRPATFKEQAAYLAVGRLDHFDHILRQVSLYRYKSRLGVESWSYKTVKDGKSVASTAFDAAQLRRIRGNPDDVALVIDVNGTEKYWHQMGTKAQNEFREAFEQGKYTGVELYDPEKRPLKRQDVDGNDLRIRYVFSNSMNSRPLTFDQLGYRGGGHWEYDYDHAVKQSIIRPQRLGGKFQNIYEGDSTFGFVSNRAMGEVFAKNMNEVARLVRARQYKDAKDYAKQHFDIEWKKLYAGFRPSKNPITGEITPPRFSTDPRQEFRVVPKGKSIHDLDKDLENKFTKTHAKTDAVLSTFVDGTKHGSLARNFQVAYTQERDSYALNEFANVGSVDKPFYEFRPAKLTDPIVTMTRSLSRIVNSSYMDDMKITAVEHWLQENMGLLDATKNEIRSSPFFYFNEGKFKNNPDNILRTTLAANNRYKIKELVGTPSTIDTALQGVKQALSDALYEMGRDTAIAKLDKLSEGKGSVVKGATTVVKAPLVAPEWLLSKVHNPVDFLRGMTYHSYLGLFAVKQVFVQSMAFTTIFGLAGLKHATAGSFASWMHIWSRINQSPAIIEKMDRYATAFGWRLGEFTEAMKVLDRTGFGVIRNEVSLDNGLHKQTFFRNDAKGFLDAGQLPFHAGNLNVRFGSWYTAFREFREANPYLKIGPVEEGQILYRANYLNTLMTRDANTILNKGLVGVPFQFFDYMKKVADVFWSRNIGKTAADRAYVRARMFFLYAMLGGAAGATGLSGLPFGDTLRKHAIEGTLPGQTDAYVQGDKLWSTLIMEGTVSTMIAAVTGKGDISKGTYYNFNNRFNPNGLQTLRDVMQTDPTFWKILLGAMGTDVGNKLSSMSGFVNAVYSMMEGDPSKEAWPLKIDDWVALAKTTATGNDIDRLIHAIAFGKWLDRHGRPTSDVSKIDAVFRTLTGLTDQRVDDMYLKTLTMKDRKAVYDRAFQQYEENRRLAEQAASNGDKEQADDYNKRAFFALTSRMVPVELWPKAIARDAQMNRDMIDKNNESYYRQYVPLNLQDKAREADRKIQKMKEK